uniref:Beta,beta-carotene 9',10'-oxygenase-like n=1 Tax=Saccoglossus kowalevskii TaxID=10224 RepID=A0ABM0MKC9_SACKO|nr:PREDICTED: beta,beta-carotene 9',10'-oxygenase-like [Saccoglossus kowalevskii]
MPGPPGKVGEQSFVSPTLKASKFPRTIPKWLTGTLLRNGPGKFEVGDEPYKHWFDGLALIHRFSFHDGQVTYQNRFLRSDAYNKAMKYNRIILSEFGTLGIPDPCKTIFERFATHLVPLNITDNDLINVFTIGDEIYVNTETCFFRRISNTETLEFDKKRINQFRTLGVLTASAHPHVDRDGTTYNMASSYMTGSCYNIVKYGKESSDDPSKNAEIIGTIRAKHCLKPSYYHSFGMTENYFIFLEQPLYINLKKLATAQLRGSAICTCLEFDNNAKSYFHLMEKKTGKKLSIEYEADGFFGMHVINAYEDEGHVVFDMCCYHDDELITKFYLDYLRNGDHEGKRHFSPSSSMRFVMPLHVNLSTTPRGRNLVTLKNCKAVAVLQKNGTVHITPEKISEAITDMPRINYDKCNQRPYTYYYGVAACKPGDFTNGLVKVNVRQKSFELWSDDDCYPSEPVFIESPGAVMEDDGVIVSTVINTRKRSAFLLVLDASTFTELGRANIPDEVECPVGFHAMYLSKQQTQLANQSHKQNGLPSV